MIELYPQNTLQSVPTSATCTHMLDTTWKLRVSAEELDKWKVEAERDGKLLSEWIREQCNAACEDNRVPDVRPEVAIPVPARRELVTAVATPPSGKPIKMCVHGTLKGYRCWRCGGLASIE